jgi:hypothetical protein
MFGKSEFVTINNQTGVVVRAGQELAGALKDHTGVWFGTYENGRPEVWTIPTEYLSSGPQSVWKH